jgi:hypothetical protein
VETLHGEIAEIFLSGLQSMHYATSRQAAGSRLYEENEFVSIYPILPAALGPRVHSASNRNEYQNQKNVSGE